MYVRSGKGALLLGAALSMLLCSFSQSGIAGEDSSDRGWPTYNNDLLGQRFSPLKQINKANVANLKQICSIKVQAGGSLAERRTAVPPDQRVMWIAAARFVSSIRTILQSRGFAARNLVTVFFDSPTSTARPSRP